MSDHHFTEFDKLNCIERELKYRRQVYPRLVAQGRMTQKRADWELALMEAIVIDYRKIVGGERLI